MDRRSFLKTSLLGGVNLLMSKTRGPSPEDPDGLREVRKEVASSCGLCPAGCGILGTLEYGRLTRLRGNPRDPNCRGRICAKGQAGINHLYNPERILHPLKRKGERGSGRWEQISWEEAYEEISLRLSELRGNGSPEEFVLLSSRQTKSLTDQQVIGRFLNAFGTPSYYHYAGLTNPNKDTAWRLTWGTGLIVYDLARSRYILNFGSNFFETHYLGSGLMQRAIEALADHGAKLVTFEVRLSQTAARSDEWFPLFPGTDGIVALAMAHVIMQEGLYEAPFLKEWTNYPPQELKRYLAKYTPEKAQKISGVPAQDIRRIAREFASTRPAVAISGGGVSKHKYGVYGERAVILLNVLIGNIDREGGLCLPRQYKLEEPPPLPPKPKPVREKDFPLVEHLLPDWFIERTASGKQKVKFLMCYKDNIAYNHPDLRFTLETLSDPKKIPYFVVIESFMSETAALADIILPETTYLEEWGLRSPPALDLTPFILLSQPLVAPRGRATSFIDICIQLAQRIGDGMERYFAFNSSQGYIEKVIASIPELADKGGLSYLKREGIWIDNGQRGSYYSYKQGGFHTRSGKLEIYSERMKSQGYEPLPAFKPVHLPTKLKDNQAVLVSFQWNVHTQDFTANCLLLSEIVHHNPVWIHPETAHRLGIKEGDLLGIKTSQGRLFYQTYITEGIHPKVIAISDNCGHWEYGKIALAKRFKSIDPQTALIWWEKEGNGIHPHQILGLNLDIVGGGQAWMDTVITIT